MSDRTRYQAQSSYAEKDSVSSYRGVDPVTGLPVLIYRFRGQAHPALPRLDSEYLPRLLAWRDDEQGGVLVVAWSSAFVPAGEASLDNLQLLDSARALADAAAAGVTHGDLSPDRFLLAGDSIVIEGFGLPWREEQVTSSQDVRDWARSVEKLGHSGKGALSGYLAELSSGTDTTADQLLTRLKDILLRGESTATEVAAPAFEVAAEESDAPAGQADGLDIELGWGGFSSSEDFSKGFDTGHGIDTALDIELDYDPSSAEAAARDAELPGLPAEEPAEAENGESAEPAASPADASPGDETDAVFRPSSTFASERLGTRRDDAREPLQPLPAGGSSSYLRRLEERAPTEAYSSAPVTPPRPPSRDAGTFETQPPERNSRRIIMIAVLLVLSAVLVTLVLYLRRSELQAVPAPMTQSVTYVIDVLVEPADLPPVNLYVLQSPDASQLRPNTILGTAPRRMALDAEGTWVFEGRFQGRVSEPVTIQIPEDRSSAVTILIPPPEPAGE